MKLIRPIALSLAIACSIALTGCDYVPDSDTVQRAQQEQNTKGVPAQTSMLAIVEVTEREDLKRILELRDKEKFVTYTYITFPNSNYRRELLCESFGYGIPRSLGSSKGSWVVCKNPSGGEPAVVYEQNRITVSPFPLPVTWP